MLRIRGLSGIGQCEDYLRSLAVDYDDTLELASTLTGLSCGGAAALLQTIVTWARTRERPRLLIARASSDEDAATQIARTLYGLAGILLAKDIERAVRKGDPYSIRREAYMAAAQVSLAMETRQYKQTAVGPAATLMVADQSTRRQLKPFYYETPDGNGQLRPEKEFVYLAGELLDAAVPQTRRSLLFGSEPNIGVLLRELIENTHRYARKDWLGRTYGRSIRGVHVRTHQVEVQSIASISDGYPPLRNYLEALEILPRRSAHQHVLEISVFDSGPGFARRKLERSLNENVDIRDEHKATQDCFLKGVSVRLEDGAGFGLGRMLIRLKRMRGFLRLRTGRTSLYKDFSEQAAEQSPYLHPDDYILLDATSDTAVATQMPMAEGALLTMLVPLRRPDE